MDHLTGDYWKKEFIITIRIEANMNKLIELLKRCEAILIAAKAPKGDIKTLKTLIENIESLGNLSLDNFYKYIQEYTKTDKQHIKKEGKIKKTSVNIEIISDIYRKIKDKKALTSSDNEILHEFESKYPNIRSFLLADLTDLYNKISEVGEKTWSIEELKLISFFHFDLKPTQKTNKTELLNELKKNIYNLDYMDSMKKQYEGKTEEKLSPNQANTADAKSRAAD